MWLGVGQAAAFFDGKGNAVRLGQRADMRGISQYARRGLQGRYIFLRYEGHADICLRGVLLQRIDSGQKPFSFLDALVTGFNFHFGKIGYDICALPAADHADVDAGAGGGRAMFIQLRRPADQLVDGGYHSALQQIAGVSDDRELYVGGIGVPLLL